MWLIDCRTLTLKEVGESQRLDEKYAILSHRWDGDEISFSEFRSRGSRSYDGTKPRSWKKIKRFCDLVMEIGLHWAWVDTCCIDKSSSAELSESINSMYRWYDRASVCIAYLNDCELQEGRVNEKQFINSQWFTRGWTLQELLAPHTVVFYDRSWKQIESRNNIIDLVSQASGIATHFILSPKRASVAQRMSWAANRKTARAEDMAYSLFGLFNVYLPLLYGEGGKNAFYRLQVEIVRTSEDESIFAWDHTLHSTPWSSLDHLPSPYVDKITPRIWRRKSGLIAAHPSDFKASHDIVKQHLVPRDSYDVSNKGLKIELVCPLLPPLYARGPRIFVATLNCKCERTDEPITIMLVKKFGSERLHCRIGPIIRGTVEGAEYVVPKLIPMTIPQRDEDDHFWEKYFGWWPGWVPCYERSDDLLAPQQLETNWSRWLDRQDAGSRAMYENIAVLRKSVGFEDHQQQLRDRVDLLVEHALRTNSERVDSKLVALYEAYLGANS